MNLNSGKKHIVFHDLNQIDYLETWHKMQQFTSRANSKENIEPHNIWFCEHNHVYTQGVQINNQNLISNPKNIPVIHSDRGGQITYHGPGQLMVYTMINFKNHKLKPTKLVTTIEQICLDFLSNLNIKAHLQAGAPGIYINNKKLISIGLRIKNFCSYHGFALNVNTELSYFNNINPCGFKQMEVINLNQFVTNISVKKCIKLLIPIIETHLNQ